MSDSEFGSDGQLHPVDRPLAPLAAAEKRDTPDDVFAASEPAAASQRLREFEDEHLGPDVVRIGGRIEKGHGSVFAAFPPEHRRHYTALEQLAEAEQKLHDAAANHAQAQTAFDSAKAHADNSAVERSESEQGA